MVTVTKEFHFEAAHKLELPEASLVSSRQLYGACFNLHGHTYILSVTLRLTDPSEARAARSGMIMDFREISRVVKMFVLDDLDHAYLNAVPWLTQPITAEHMVKDIAQRMRTSFTDVDLVHIRLYEGGNRTSWVDWYNEEIPS